MTDMYLEQFLWKCHQNLTDVNIGPGNRLKPYSNKPFAERMLTKMNVAVS